MQQFRISEDGFKKLRKRWFTIMIPAMIGLLAIITLTNIGSSKPGEINTLPFVLPFLLALFGFSIYRSFRKQTKFLRSYSVTLSDEGITREQLDTPPLSISFMEIKEIIKTEKGGFRIKGVDRTDLIIIPPFIDQPEALEASLQTLAPITFNTKDPLYRKYGPLLFLLAIGMMLCVYTVSNKIVVGVCAALLTGLFGWAFYEIQTNKNVPGRSKKTSWFFLLVMVAILYIAYAKLTGIWEPR